MYTNDYATIAYFDIFRYPLTRIELELWQYQLPGITLSKKAILQRNGFYYLSGHGGCIDTRQDRYIYSDYKIERARKYIKLFCLLPSIQMIALCNSLGYQNASEQSDIDFFIIVKPGTAWLTRFWLQSFVRLLRLGPFDRGVRKDSLCLTFFLTSDNLDISGLQTDTQDIYLQYWLTQLMPLYDPFGYYQNFLNANSWIKKHIPNFLPYHPLTLRWVNFTPWSVLFSILTFWWWEKFLQKIQFIIMPEKIRAMANQDTRVVMNNCVLKFHVDDNRLKYKKLWQERIQY